ncbi:MAG: hypothetical protein QOG40_1550, partial [Solirubrobacteraceae bacterium]|nr:hypothetical protein [Solirubrobacteraceae bacterium]
MPAQGSGEGRPAQRAIVAAALVALAAIALTIVAVSAGPAQRKLTASANQSVPGAFGLASDLPQSPASTGSAPDSLPPSARNSPAGPYVAGSVLLAFRSGVSASRRHTIAHQVGGGSARRLGPAIKPVGHGRAAGAEYLAPYELRVPDGQVLSAVGVLRRDPAVAYAEPNYLQHGSATPNDTSFPLQWGDENTGQAIPIQNANEELGAAEKGTAGADDRAARAWQQTTGSRAVVIGEVDTGVDNNHPDLAANVWSNPGGIDGCAVGTRGYNVVAKKCDPLDKDATYQGHGTHVAGIMGAVGSNGVGVA